MFGKTQQARFKVTGMSCGHCTGRVKAALEGLSGVKKASVELDEGGLAVVDYKAEAVTPEALAAAIIDTGYQAQALD